MGKDWYWGGRRRSSNSKRRQVETDIPSGGCMCAVFQAFDFHPFNLSINQQSTFNSSSPITTLPKGAEAPRNSLESEDGTLSSISKQDSFKIPKNIRIKTKGGSFNDLSNELCSPGTKTPTLVARLMGLDLLPDANSPSNSSSSSSLSTPKRQSHYHNRPKQDIKIMKHRHSTDSVIKTPRLSSEKTSYVEHRLSLQINKENRNVGEDLETPRSSFSKRKFFDDNNNCKSPSHYARQIVKQVKESVSRKVGIDITNTVKNREQEKVKQDFVAQIKFKKALKPSMKPLDESNQGKHSTNSSHSPRLSRFNDTNHKHSPTTTPRDQNTHQVLKQSSPPHVVNIEAQVSRVSTKPKTQAMSEKEDKKSFPKCKKTGHGNLSPRINSNKPPQTSSIRKKQEESFITNRGNDIKTKSKRTHPLSNNNVPNLLPLKTHPSLPATKVHQKQVNDDDQEAKNMSQLFSSSCHNKYTLATRGTTNDGSKSNGFAAATGAENEGSEYQYITTILNRSGIHRTTVTNLQHFQWFSSTHPLDPSIFHRLELYPTSKDSNFTQKNLMGPRCNRRLLFDLVDEVLSEILIRPKCYHGLLLETVWKRVRSFPRAKCEVLEDIDGLIEMKEVMDKVKEEEEEEKLVAEIEGKVLDMLVNETLTVMVSRYV